MQTSRETKQWIMSLATGAVAGLVMVTWALTRVSAWIVLHDPVWGQMDKEGAETEHMIVEVFFAARSLLLGVELVVGVVFLVLLWRALFAPQKASGPNDANAGIMDGPPLDLNKAHRFVVSLALIAMAAAGVDIPFGHRHGEVRGPCAGVGFMAALLCLGVSFWLGLRVREKRFWGVLLLSLPPLGYWCWRLHQAVYG